ncbi:MAG: hypothetical protein ACYS0G_08325 [Planctomycetota bacterium]|jgi:hypothetical protein
MYGNESELAETLRSAEMRIDPDPAHIGAVRERMATVAREAAGRRRRARRAWLVGLLLLGACGTGLAATGAGRGFVRWIFTPVLPRHEVTVTTPDGSTWTQGSSAEPIGPEQEQAAARLFHEIAALSQAGLGELVGLLEGPDQTAYSIRYALADGTSTTVATGVPTELQAVMMQINEIRRLRDAGAGKVIVESRSPVGLGFYVIRFELPDRTVDVQTWYPPGTRDEREAIFAETRELKADWRFSVEQAGVSVEDPEQGVVGTLRYTLSDGRTVGIVEPIPPEVITPDGAYVVVPGTGDRVPIGSGGIWTAPDGSLYVSSGGAAPASPDEEQETIEKYREVHEIQKAGGGRLVGLLEGPGWDGELGTTTFRVSYTLVSGETMTLGGGAPSARQRANMRIDEIQRLRDEGAGEIVARSESPLGLGGFTIRFTLFDGETVDLRTVYPPGTREDREAIFAETRKLKAQRRFSVTRAQVAPVSGVWGILIYTLSDGRSVRHYEQVPTDLITSDGRHIVMPSTGETVEIAGPPGG